MADFNKAIPHILKWEGGWVDHPNDPGGKTNRGITFTTFGRVAKPVLGIAPTVENLKNLTEDQAKKIYRSEFWDKMMGDAIKDQSVATIIFDGFVNMGRHAIRIAQDVVNVDRDGIVGSKTINAINAANAVELFANIKQARIDYYNNLAVNKPAMKVFLKGWLNRINSFEYGKV